jgi:hypothetical protein
MYGVWLVSKQRLAFILVWHKGWTNTLNTVYAVYGMANEKKDILLPYVEENLRSAVSITKI